MAVVLVAIGGLIGVLCRWGVIRLTGQPEGLLWATAAINVGGSFLVGLLIAEGWFSREVREAVAVGFLGGLTTFSTFSLHVVLEVEDGHAVRAVLYLLVSVLGGILAAAAGYALRRGGA